MPTSTLSTTVALCLLAIPVSAQHAANLIHAWTGPGGAINFGFGLDIIGDFDRDGHADVALGSPLDSYGAGNVRVYSGKTGRVLAIFEGDAPRDHFGYAVAGAGDVDADGFVDLVVGAPFSSRNGGTSGMIRVISGRTRKALYTIAGAGSMELFGRSVAAAGDVNRDGSPDLIVGADYANLRTGAARVLSGRDGKVLHTFLGQATLDRFGYSVDGAGDVDSDGYADLIVGAPYRDAGKIDAGLARVYSGRTGQVLYEFAGTNANDLLGYSVCGAGDVNGDGVADVAVGAHRDDGGGADAGTVRVYSGKDGKLVWSFDGQPNELFGWSIAAAGDVDRDGYADVFAAKMRATIFKVDGLSRLLSGRTGQVIGTFKGLRVGGGGDVDLDGFPDVVASSHLNYGAVWVYSGRQRSLRADIQQIRRSVGGTQHLTLDLGVGQANRSYRIFGSITGTRPGVLVSGLWIPLLPDFYTSFTIANPSSPYHKGFAGTLDALGRSTASIVVPPNLVGSVTFYHAAVVLTGSTLHTASNAVSLTIR